jgi:hypothetical protein
VGLAEKPLDLGTGRVCASFDATTAAWLSIGRPDERHGFIELSAVPPFDESQRGDPTATRRHRTELTRAEHAFLCVELDGLRPTLTADLSDPERITWSAPDLAISAGATAVASELRQTWSIGRRALVEIVLRGALDRPALAEVTELVPPTPTGAGPTSRRQIAGGVRLEAPNLPATVEVAISPAVAWEERDGMLVGRVAWPDGNDRLELDIVVRLDGTADACTVAEGADAEPRERLTGRALAYIRGCTALSVAAGERAFLTDHRILPLSWTRDAYWQALALLAADGPGDRDRVADHLRWLWRRCERPDGRWVRSHHANGLRKDLAFQADQQLYPMIELADYWRRCRSLPGGVAWEVEVPRAWSAALDEIDAASGLISCAENAADDPAVAPFIGASQVLLWYAALRLAEIAGLLSMGASELRSTAVAVRAAFDRHVAAPGQPWAYAVDARGARIVYHDANDLPVALAPAWGFCDPTDPGWRATMRFAFGASNPGWVDGARPGLGSAHTPGPWTLGDVQAWLVARSADDAAGQAAVIRRLEEVAFADGMLPEAYAPDRHDDWRIRHWFAWPGAAFAALRMLDGRGLLHERLSARVTR